MYNKAQATRLRLQGKSYGEIMKELHISSKGTLSYWFRNLKLSEKAKKHLKKNRQLAYKRGLFAFNEKRTKTILAENESIFYQSCQEIQNLSHKELLLIGATLYWAEGINRELSRGYRLASFTNSDPTMVRVFMRYVREVLLVSDDKIKPGVIIYPNLNAKRVAQFWADIINIPESTFWVSIAVSKASKMRKPSNYLPHGTVHIRISSRQIFHKIQGHIEGIRKKLQ